MWPNWPALWSGAACGATSRNSWGILSFELDEIEFIAVRDGKRKSKAGGEHVRRHCSGMFTAGGIGDTSVLHCSPRRKAFAPIKEEPRYCSGYDLTCDQEPRGCGTYLRRGELPFFARG